MSHTTLQPMTYYNFEDWLIDDRKHSERTEYVAGEVFAMTEASISHNLIVTNIVRELSLQMKGRPCCVYASDLKVRINTADACCYPDVLAICGEPEFYDKRRDMVLNPVLIVEVLSTSTEAYDRGDKFAIYRNLESLNIYILVAQHKVSTELYIRGENGRWNVSYYKNLHDTMEIASLKCTIKLDEVYDKVKFM